MMEGWEDIKLGDVLDKIIGGGTPSKNNQSYWNGNIPWCSVKDMSDDKFIVSNTEDSITEVGLKNSSANLISKGTVVTATRMGLGRAFITGCDMAINQDLKALIPNSKIDNKFLLWLIIVNRKNLDNLGTGSTVKGIKLETLKGIKINLPPLTTQRKIASILSAYNNLIESNLKRIKLLEEKAQITYEEWFVRMKFPGHETTSINKETGLPEGWEKKAIKDWSKLVSGFAFKSKDFVENGNYKLVTIKNVQEGVFINKTSDTLSIIPEKVKPEHLLKDGDIIMSLTGNVGRTCMVYGENYLLNQRVLKIQPFHFKSFIYWLLRCRKTIKELENLSNGAAQQNLSPINMGKHKIVIPSKELLKRFSEVFDVQLNVSIELNKQNQLLKEARDILLPRLMTGMIDVEQLNIETLQPPMPKKP